MNSTVFLGLVDQEIDPTVECHWTDNRIGGNALFSPKCRQDCARELNLFNCNHCDSKAVFLLQISCPIDHTSNERVLYIFACANSQCTQKEIIVLRAYTPPVNLKSKQQQPNVALFKDEWSDDNEDKDNSDSLNEFCDNFEQNVNINDEKVMLNNEHAQLKPHYISVFEEPKGNNILVTSPPVPPTENLPLENENGGESYERSYTNAFKDNRVNYHFYKRLQRCPEQIIRYAWNSVPLLSEDCQVIPENCSYCGGKRTFELQLMPALVELTSRLKCNAADSTLELDFETILVYTCHNSCSKSGKTLYKEQVLIFKENFQI